jgi:hypothetical protein
MKSDERRASYRCDITYTNNSVRCSVENQLFFNVILRLSNSEGLLFLVVIWYDLAMVKW